MEYLSFPATLTGIETDEVNGNIILELSSNCVNVKFKRNIDPNSVLVEYYRKKLGCIMDVIIADDNEDLNSIAELICKEYVENEKITLDSSYAELDIEMGYEFHLVEDIENIPNLLSEKNCYLKILPGKEIKLESVKNYLRKCVDNRRLAIDFQGYYFGIEMNHTDYQNKPKPEMEIIKSGWKEHLRGELVPCREYLYLNILPPLHGEYSDIIIPERIGREINKVFWEKFNDSFLNKNLELQVLQNEGRVRNLTKKFFGEENV